MSGSLAGYIPVTTSILRSRRLKRFIAFAIELSSRLLPLLVDDIAVAGLAETGTGSRQAAALKPQ